MTEANIPIESQLAPGYEFHPDLAGEGILEAIAAAPTYQKRAHVRVRFAEKEEIFETWIGDRLETKKVVKVGSPIMINPKGEEYPTQPETFTKRYDVDPENPGWYFAKGKVKAIKNPWGKPIVIISPWGLMYGDENCRLASTADLETNELETPGKVYVIDQIGWDGIYHPVE